jgi:tRNA-specific 2-thiouridylase
MNSSTRHLEGRRVILGLSGGVDSAVAAHLLRDRGADVHALHMTNWEDDDGYCTAADDLQDARRIAERLGIPFHHVNFAAQYRDQVFSRFLDEYRAGRTPNPDVLCNREIKFGVFRDHARRLGGDFIATGHYAKTVVVDGRTRLEKAFDQSKDQSYFLHAVSEEALAETIFPLGEMLKSEVRDIAREQGFEVHDKKDSTGICFIGERPFREFLATYLPASPGQIRTPDGKVVGEHHGLAYYTLGQRQGLGIGGLREFGDEPWYVAAKDATNNVLIAVQGDDPLRFAYALLASEPGWINGEPEALGNGGVLSCNAKIRYRQSDQACDVRRGPEGQLIVAFPQPQADVTPGQFIVFYDGDTCLGGAVIERAIDSPEALLKTG